MALNKNHEFEEVNGIKCGIVEKNVKPERVAFLKELLEFNKYEVVTAPTPPPKPASAPAARPKPVTPAVEGEQAAEPPVAEAQAKPDIPAPPPTPPPPETFTIGVTDTTFNPINAIFGRMLKTRDGHIVTLAYWEQKENVSNDEIPYFDHP